VAQREVELILVRQLASYLTLPMFVVDTKGTLLYFNEAAEPLLGRRFEETDELTFDEWTAVTSASAPDGRLLEAYERPLLIALEQHRPAFATMRLRSTTGDWSDVDVTCFPLTGQSGRELGAVATFYLHPPSTEEPA
jgi:PAS domain-containing protein